MKRLKAGKNFIREFTLVELLFVITIITILASLLPPALKGARDMAQRTKCANNLKQLGVATFCYIDDGDGYLPSVYSSFDPVFGNWMQKLTFYIDPERKYRMHGDSVFRCPAHNSNGFIDLWGWYLSYAANDKAFVYMDSSRKSGAKIKKGFSGYKSKKD